MDEEYEIRILFAFHEAILKRIEPLGDKTQEAKEYLEKAFNSLRDVIAAKRVTHTHNNLLN